MDAIICIIVLIILVALLFSKVKSTANEYLTNSETQNKAQSSEKAAYSSNINPVETHTEPQKYSDFQMELRNSTRTPAGVQNEKNKELIEKIKKNVPVDYDYIKKNLLSKARSGEYTTINGNKYITIDHYLGRHCIISDCVKVKKTSLTKITDNLKCTIVNPIVYNAYLEELNKYAKPDNVNVKIMLVNNSVTNCYKYYDIPCDINTTIIGFKFSYIIRCSIMY